MRLPRVYVGSGMSAVCPRVARRRVCVFVSIWGIFNESQLNDAWYEGLSLGGGPGGGWQAKGGRGMGGMVG